MKRPMKRLVWLLIVVIGVCAGRIAAQSRPDFSGTWTGSGSSLTIRQTGDRMTVDDGERTRSYNLDGSASRFSGGDARYTATARWVGSALVVAITTVSPIGSWEDLEVYSLDYGPKLTVVQVGTQTTRPMMYTKTRTYERR